MKKLVLVLLVAMLSVPAFAADPNITIGVVGTTVTVGYTADSADLISGMGLTVELSSGTIANFTDLQSDSDSYNISMSYLQDNPTAINTTTQTIDNYGTPVVSGGNSTASVVVEYCALYERGVEPAPATADSLFSFDIVGGTSPVTVTVSANHAGGIVTEDLVQFNIVRTKSITTAAPAPTITSIAVSSANPGTTATFTNIAGTNFAAGATVQLTKTGKAPIAVTTTFVSATQLTGSVALPLLTQQGTWNVVVTVGTQSATLADAFTVNECVKNTDLGYSKWTAAGRPSCWCFQRQCRGDANGAQQGAVTKTWIGTIDLNILKAAYGKNDTQLLAVTEGMSLVCANFDHQTQGAVTKIQVGTNDLNLLKAWYGKTTVTVCPSTYINFWTN